MPDADPPPQRYGLKAREFQKENQPATPPAPSVHEILRANLAHGQAVEDAKPMDLTDHRTKRTRDYWLLMIAGNGLGGLLWFLLPSSQLISILLPGVLLVLNLGLYWIMFQVMEKY
ncbi:MAG: hypothetical protein KIT44_01670 [Opitutaceae bacterium]|nr:hypothetical protein [Opitutaceae bacterium]